MIKKILLSFNKKERFLFALFVGLILTASLILIILISYENSEFKAVKGGAWREGLIGQPIHINPVISNHQTDQEISALIYSPLAVFLQNIEVNNKGQKYTLQLKENLKWEDGKPLTSDDIIFTIETIQNLKSSLGGSEAIALLPPLLFNQDWQKINLERISELQVKIILPSANIFFEDKIKKLQIIPKHIFGSIPPVNLHLSEYNLEPISSGPYCFKDLSKRKDGFIKWYHLTPNPYYAGQPPFIKDFYFKFYDTEENLLADFKKREIDGFGNVFPFKIKYPKTEISSITMFRYYALFFNAAKNPLLKEVRIRKILNESINKDGIIKEIFNNTADVFNFSFEKPEWPNSDPIKLKEELEKIKTTQKINQIQLNIIVPDIDYLKETAQYIKNNWLVLGIETEIFAVQPEDKIEGIIKDKDYEILLFGNILENKEDLFPFWHSSQNIWPGLNLSSYQNKNIDQLLENIRKELNPQKRIEYLNRIQNSINQDMPAIFLFNLPYFYMHRDKLNGLDNKTPIIYPADRFLKVSEWSVIKARVLKSKEGKTINN